MSSLIKKIRKDVPGIILRTTLIVGYPGETEEDFEILKNWVKEMRFERLGCFTYSHEENTHAFKLDDNVSEITKQERCNIIMDIQSQDQILLQFGRHNLEILLMELRLC